MIRIIFFLHFKIPLMISFLTMDIDTPLREFGVSCEANILLKNKDAFS